MPTPRAQLRGSPVLLLDLDVHGRVYRHASEPADLTTEAGEALSYDGGLAVDFEAAAGGSPVANVAITSYEDDFASFIARGALPSGWTGTLRRWWPGQSYEDAEVLMSGAVVSPAWDALGAPIEFQLREWYWEAPGVYPPATAQVNPATWPVSDSSTWKYDPNVDGATYPMVYGQPGIAINSTRPASYGSPGLLVEVPVTLTSTMIIDGKHRVTVGISTAVLLGSKLLIAGHEVSASTVVVWDVADLVLGHTCTVRRGKDKLGRVISYVDFSEVSTSLSTYMRPVEGHEYWVSWRDGAGKLGPQRQALRGAGEIILDLLRSSTRRVDVGRQEAQRAFLDTFKLDFYINEPGDPEEWINANLLPVLPLVRRVSHEGVYYQALRYDARSEDAVMALDASDGGNVVRDTSTGVQLTDEAEIANDLTLDYAREGGGTYYRQLHLQALPLSADTTRIGFVSHICSNVSYQTYGTRAWAATTDVIARPAIAALALQHLVLRYALPHQLVSYTGDAVDLANLQAGDVVTITDAEVGFSGRPALCGEPRFNTETTITIPLIVLADYAAWTRS